MPAAGLSHSAVTPQDLLRFSLGTLPPAIMEAVAGWAPGSGDPEPDTLLAGVLDILSAAQSVVETYLQRPLVARGMTLEATAPCLPHLPAGRETAPPFEVGAYYALTAFPVSMPSPPSGESMLVRRHARRSATTGDYEEQDVYPLDEGDDLSPGDLYITTRGALGTCAMVRAAAYHEAVAKLGPDPILHIYALVGWAPSGDAAADAPPLPGDIRRAVLSIAMHDLRQAVRGLVGVERSTQRVDQMVIESVTERQGYVDDVLSSIRVWRRETLFA